MGDLSCNELLDEGLRLHQAGNLREAEGIYQKVLETEPDNPDALHLLGVLSLQVSQLGAAEELIRRAISIDAGRADFQLNLGNVLSQLGQHEEAIAAYRAALALKDDFPEAHNNLGLVYLKLGRGCEARVCFERATQLRADDAEAWNNLGSALLADGKAGEALSHIERAVGLRPKYPEALNNLGSALKCLSRMDEAGGAFVAALESRAEFPEALNNLGLVLHARGESAEAVGLYRRAISIRPEYAEARYNLSIALRAAGDLKQATVECRIATELRAAFFEAHNNLGVLLHEQGDLSSAILAFEKALVVHPDYPEAHNNLANVLRQSGKLKDAVRHYRMAVTLRPDYAEAHNNLGSALQQSDRPGEAMASYRRAIQLRPDLAEAHNNRGNLFKDQAELDEAIASYQRACELNSNDPAADSNRVYTLYFHPGYTPAAILREHLRWHERHAAGLLRTIKPHDNDPVAQRKLRIGYVSPDFRDHCQAMFTIPLLSHHDRRGFEVHLYRDVGSPDAVTERIRGYADQWHNIVGMSDQQVAEQIRRDRIDILIDLTLHMSHNRMPVFARKPAPVQVTWLGYPGTTGLATMDYRLSDPYLDPPGVKGEAGSHDRHYVEQTVRLADSFWCYDPLATEPEPNALPALKNRYVTFGCLNNFCKVNSKTLGLWGQVMGAVPGSRLLVLAPRGSAREHLLEALAESGVAPTRVEFVDRQAREKYLAYYHRIDVALDTFPYNGHTTTLDALWMGVPVATTIGRSAVSRGAYSQLANLGMKELAARSEKQFVRMTAELAQDVGRLSRLRGTLRERLSKSPLMDGPRFAAGVEAALRWMWQEWLSSRTRGLAVPA